MSKHKKTREQKIISDLRRKLSLQDELPSVSLDLNKKSDLKSTLANTVNISPSYVSKNNINSQQKSIATNTSPYLFHDLYKTGILTGIIITAQLVLFFLLKNHTIVFPMVKY